MVEERLCEARVGGAGLSPGLTTPAPPQQPELCTYWVLGVSV